MSLAESRCVPCKGVIPALTREEIQPYLEQVNEWELAPQANRIKRDFTFADFQSALRFVNQVGELAEDMGHHPDIQFGWGHASIEIWTHKIGGLHENDFILAARVDQLSGI